MDMDAHRRRRLQDLVDKETSGNVSAYARKHGQDATRLRQVLNENYRNGRSFGEGTARRLEKDLELPNLYFDMGIEGITESKHNSASADVASTGQERDLIDRSTDRSIRNIVQQPRGFGELEPTKMGRREVPVISFVQAGMMTEVIDPFSLGEGFETILTDVECSDHTFALRIKGRSMLPRFEPGDIIVVDPNKYPMPGQFVVAKNTEEEATFKKYRPRGVNERGNIVFELVPLNDDFATLHSERDHLRIVGVAIEHRKPLLE